jgi:hypothetical protein
MALVAVHECHVQLLDPSNENYPQLTVEVDALGSVLLMSA